MSYTDPMMVLVALLVIGLVIAVIMMMSQPSTNTVYVRDDRDHWYHRWFNRSEEPRFRPMLY